MTGTSRPVEAEEIVVGVDTHKDIHVAVAVDGLGRLGERSAATSSAGLAELRSWAQQLGGKRIWAVEGTGSYGAGLVRRLQEAGETVREVSRPDRRLRRHRGKSDPIDAEATARAPGCSPAWPPISRCCPTGSRAAAHSGHRVPARQGRSLRRRLLLARLPRPLPGARPESRVLGGQDREEPTPRSGS